MEFDTRECPHGQPGDAGATCPLCIRAELHGLRVKAKTQKRAQLKARIAGNVAGGLASRYATAAVSGNVLSPNYPSGASLVTEACDVAEAILRECGL
jgi:hypothetical protein